MIADDNAPISSGTVKKTPRKWTLKKVGLLALLAIVIWYGPCHAYSTSFETTITIAEDGKTIKRVGGDEGDTYLIRTESGDSYKIEDNWSHWQNRSFDLYSDLKVGHTYNIEAYGWRSGFWSSFPNIYAAEEEVQ